MRAALALVLAFTVTAAQAQYKCVASGGEVTYQQAACPSGEVTASRLPVVPESARRPDYIRRAIEAREFVVGLTRKEVYDMAGAPAQENTALTPRGTSRQLVYEQLGTTIYVYTGVNDVVQALKVSAPR